MAKNKSKYVVTKGTTVFVSKEAVETTVPKELTFLELGCLGTEISYTGGAKSDIDVTTLCSTEKEQINGLPDPGEITFNGNWVPNDEAIDTLHEAYVDDSTHAFRLIFPDGTGYTWNGQVRQENFTVAPGDVIKGGFTIRMRGQLEKYNAGS